ncbi:MAG: ImmA/IrrE family metallo-endopeptidase, partial [Vicinamibacteria bacterium]
RHVRTLTHDDPGSWSAVTLSVGTKRLVLLNPSHSHARRASDLMHELSHLVIGHDPSRVDVTEDGTLLVNTYDGDQEDEANWLAGTLLLPRPALIHIRSRGADLAWVGREYGVSIDMLRYRLNITGVEYQLRTRKRLAKG